MAEQTVFEKVCNEKHKAVDQHLDVVDKRLNKHSGKIGSVEDAIIRLTALQGESRREKLFDKILIITVFIISIILAAMVLGPAITGKILGGVVK